MSEITRLPTRELEEIRAEDRHRKEALTSSLRSSVSSGSATRILQGLTAARADLRARLQEFERL